MPLWNIENARIQQFVVFKTILEQRSITKTADLLGLTQSAVSKNLKLLRHYFSDPLFVRTAAGMEPSQRAFELAPRILTILNEVDALGGEREFIPAELTSRFVISTTDQIQHFLLPNLLAILDKEAPHARLGFTPLDRSYAARDLESGSVNVVIAVNWAAPDHLIQRHLYRDDFVCLFRQGHPLKKQELTLDRYVSSTHMMVAPLASEVGLIDKLLADLRHKRNVRLSIPYFMQVGKILANSDLIVTLPRMMAMTMMADHPLVIKELPLQVPELKYYTFWHKRYDKDKSRSWLTGLIERSLKMSLVSDCP